MFDSGPCDWLGLPLLFPTDFLGKNNTSRENKPSPPPPLGFLFFTDSLKTISEQVDCNSQGFHVCKFYDTRSRMPYRLPIPRTNCRKRMFCYNALQLWNNISDNEFVYFTDLKKFRSNYFDCIMRKFTLDSFKTDRIF